MLCVLFRFIYIPWFFVTYNVVFFSLSLSYKYFGKLGLTATNSNNNTNVIIRSGWILIWDVISSIGLVAILNISQPKFSGIL